MFRYKVLMALLVLIFSASPALAEIKFSVEEPASESTRTGIGQISGWAVSDVEIISVEAMIDGVSLGLVPYGGTRLDVAASFSEFPNSEFSGWTMKWNFSLLEPGEHLVTIIITDMDGLKVSKDVVFSTTSFKSQFIADAKLIKTAGKAVSSPEDGVIMIADADIDGETVDVELKWDKAAQQFLISRIVGGAPQLQNQSPKANAGPGFSIESGENAVVEGGASDPDGNVVSYAWSQVSGPPVDLVNANQQTVEFMAPDKTGSVRLRLKVMDDKGASDQDDAVIKVVDNTPEENEAPQADAGPNRKLEINETIDVTGDASDSDGTIVEWHWEQLSGVPLGLANTSAQTVQITAPDTAGEARVRLTVTDNDGAIDEDQFDITIEAPENDTNSPPTVNAGSNFTMETGETIFVNGTASDSDGTIVAWQWHQVSGQGVNLQNATTNQVRFTAPDNAGTLVLRLTVTDDDGAWTDDDVTVTVEEPAPPPNQPPNVNAGSNKTVNQGDSVTVAGSASDSDGNIMAWQWQQVSGQGVNLQNATTSQVQFVAPNSAGTIVLRLTVTDDDGASTDDDVAITVEVQAAPPNQSPNTNAGSDQTVSQGESVTVTGSASDSDGSIVAWQWQQVSGQSVSLQNATTSQVRFTAPNSAGTIVLRLRATDDDGAWDDDNVAITVEEPAPPPNQTPNANAGSDQTVNQGDSVTVTGSANDSDGTIVSWSWTRISGPAVSLSGANSSQVQFTAPDSNGDIRLQLTVTDNDGAQDSDDVIITVEADVPDDDTTGEMMQSMLATINAARGQTQVCNGTSYPAQAPFSWSNSLANVAMEHSMDMASQGYFSHTSADGTSMGNRVFPAWSGNRVAENIAASSSNQSNTYVVNLWLGSTSGHCEVIMNPDYTHIGVGAGHNPTNGYTYHHFWTLDFGG